MKKVWKTGEKMTEAPGLYAGRRHWLVYACDIAAGSMVICFAAILIQFLLWLFPPLIIRGMLFVCALVVMEAFLSFWLLKHLSSAQKRVVFFRGTELVILLVAVKLFTELLAGPVTFWNNLIRWPDQFPFNILTGQYLLTLVPVLASWWAGYLFAADLALLGTGDIASQDERFKTTPVRSVILHRFLSLGTIVVILAGIPAQKVFQTYLPVTSKSASAAVLYFILGIVLLSLTKYITLETSWWQARLHIPAQIPRRWLAYSALILAILVFLISWLPTHYEMGLMGLIKFLNALYIFLYQFALVLYGLILLIFSILSSLLVRNSADTHRPIPQITPSPVNTPPPDVSAINWGLVRSVLLWGSLIILVIVALVQYIAFNRDLFEELRHFRLFRYLFSVWNRFKASFKRSTKTIGAFIQNNLNRLRKMDSDSARSREWDFINPHRLPPRQKVIFYYLAFVRRAQEAGLLRLGGQTPYEYARFLNTSLKKEGFGVDEITESFMEARYSRHDIPPKAARQVESIWEAIRRVLRNVRKSHLDGQRKDN